MESGRRLSASPAQGRVVRTATRVLRAGANVPAPAPARQGRAHRGIRAAEQGPCSDAAPRSDPKAHPRDMAGMAGLEPAHDETKSVPVFRRSPGAPDLFLFPLAGAGGIEPPYVGTKNRCLTAWRRPNGEGIEKDRRSPLPTWRHPNIGVCTPSKNCGARGKSRTPNLPVRSRALCPVELRGRRNPGSHLPGTLFGGVGLSEKGRADPELQGSGPRAQRPRPQRDAGGDQVLIPRSRTSCPRSGVFWSSREELNFRPQSYQLCALPLSYETGGPGALSRGPVRGGRAACRRQWGRTRNG